MGVDEHATSLYQIHKLEPMHKRMEINPWDPVVVFSFCSSLSLFFPISHLHSSAPFISLYQSGSCSPPSLEIFFLLLEYYIIAMHYTFSTALFK